MRIACQQTILKIYRALFVIFEKAVKFEIVGGSLWAKCILKYKSILGYP